MIQTWCLTNSHRKASCSQLLAPIVRLDMTVEKDQYCHSNFFSNPKSHAISRKSLCFALNIGSADYPRYRATNMEVIELDTDFGSTFSGVLTDDCGRVQAIWGSFSTQLKYGGSTSEDHQFVRGLPVFAISEVLNKIISGGKGPGLLINGIKKPMPLVRILVVELYPTLLSKARSFGLSDDWVQFTKNADLLVRMWEKKYMEANMIIVKEARTNSETIRHYHLRIRGFVEEIGWNNGLLLPYSVQAKDSKTNFSSVGHEFLRRFQSPTIFLKVACEGDWLLPIIVGEFAIEKLIHALREHDDGECPSEFQFLKNFLRVFTIDTLVKPLPPVMAYNVSRNLSFFTSILTQFFDEKGIANAHKSLGLG
ncbi:hypothetical protein IFM89_000089 [Coptis chinensis]|uniref:Uncharacterized protein n=1 Tax=Coptis chinensis TaxID=261450 RepID=A0A835I0F8_9MAGN|nr:hypothetical protein IFM89_000089 [Coptis chinensis]